MPLDLLNTVWSELKRFIPDSDIPEAAEIVVSSMIDHDYDADDIKTAFRGDKDIKSALEPYLDLEEEEIEEDYDEYDEDEDY